MPIAVILLTRWNPAFWPLVPILLGGWVVVMLVVRVVGLYFFSIRTDRKAREVERQDVRQLEARIDEAQRKSRNKG